MIQPLRWFTVACRGNPPGRRRHAGRRARLARCGSACKGGRRAGVRRSRIGVGRIGLGIDLERGRAHELDERSFLRRWSAGIGGGAGALAGAVTGAAPSTERRIGPVWTVDATAGRANKGVRTGFCVGCGAISAAASHRGGDRRVGLTAWASRRPPPDGSWPGRAAGQRRRRVDEGDGVARADPDRGGPPARQPASGRRRRTGAGLAAAGEAAASSSRSGRRMVASREAADRPPITTATTWRPRA